MPLAGGHYMHKYWVDFYKRIAPEPMNSMCGSRLSQGIEDRDSKIEP
jgi:hypothetical protein